ncbi:hypothetical protein BDF20DRAFT_147029 [Mycotypha africana]|uniref:uncharacterized protein n=1 Tax=Mycotypha africana TaxID=64632 RepID=UPI0023001F1D|nr:uncharacterized protein BDF20DRAFT_147029 [Mycotypha africana]KAI8969143.1 hypothetical protein BDF20DRAFT_147029 [Mycotypha africana]
MRSAPTLTVAILGASRRIIYEFLMYNKYSYLENTMLCRCAKCGCTARLNVSFISTFKFLIVVERLTKLLIIGTKAGEISFFFNIFNYPICRSTGKMGRGYLLFCVMLIIQIGNECLPLLFSEDGQHLESYGSTHCSLISGISKSAYSYGQPGK